MLRSVMGGVVALVLALPGLAHGEASVKVLKSPVVAGEVARIQAHIPGELKASLRAVAAIGAVSPFVQTGPETYEADYSPGRNTGPALAEIVVFEDRPGGALAYTTANIADTVRATVKLKSHEPVFVRAGSVRKGPYHVEAHGELTVTFVANGELATADVESAQGRPIANIPVKVTSLKTLAVARPSRLHSGDARPAELIYVSPYERPGKADAPRATVSAGKVALDIAGSPDYGLRYVVTPPPTMAGPLAVKLADARGNVLAQTSFTAAGPAPATIKLRLPPKSLGPGERTTLGVNLVDAKGGEAEGDLVLEADSGKVNPPLPLGPGTFTASFIAPTAVPRDGVVHLRARVLGEDLSGSGEIAIHGGAPAKVVFQGPQGGRAGELVSVEAQVLDAAGNPTEAKDMQFNADHGEVAQVTERSPGHYLVQLRSAEDASALGLSARSGPTTLEGHHQLSLERGPELPFALIGPEGGISNNFGKLSAVSLAVAGQFLLGPTSSVPARATAGFLVGYLPETQQTLQSSQATSGTLQLSRVALMARGGGYYGLGDLGLFGGGGLGAMRLSGELTSVGRPTLPMDSWRPAAGLYGGAGYKVGPGMISLELRATYAKVDLQSAELRVKGPVGGVDGALGYLFAL